MWFIYFFFNFLQIELHDQYIMKQAKPNFKSSLLIILYD